MAGVKRCVMLFLVLTFLKNLSKGDAANEEVSCVFMESCLLPCGSQADTGLQVVHWMYGADNTTVHSYYENEDQLKLQDQRFKRRTSLFKDQLSRGNASLLLTEVQVRDEGRYECYTGTDSSTKDQGQFINLKVDAPVRKVNLQQMGNTISCSSEGIYPEPEVTWAITSPSEMTFKTKTKVQKTEQSLFNIASSLVLSHSLSELISTCNVSTHSGWRRATLRHKRSSAEDKGISGRTIGAIVCGVLAIIVLALIALCKFKNRHKPPRHPHRELTEDQII